MILYFYEIALMLKAPSLDSEWIVVLKETSFGMVHPRIMAECNFARFVGDSTWKGLQPITIL